ncbi:D-methionine transport system substrate-binding protein [Microbacterium sp. LKL04]|uniref:MetQ/NlpA family ABC transporter substrate-binding protein n=1 Tax=unclassified Microbacterium TaxID=2609290 RepID=UPI000875C563|nr:MULTISPECIES: MetQ/NlpA family ABC transporter substrate-binding protein [unclassified Microbacterium]MDQ1126424.1 D-methionine transport system substrate-binding protein [Microbacterium sp. SORGH_AS_0505]SCX92275.1 D-methionine transport system substrate-binding protein [Microbacterium sp. LKL04]
MSDQNQTPQSDLRAAVAGDKKRTRIGLTVAIAIVAVAAIVGGAALLIPALRPADAAASGGDAPAKPISVKIAVSEDSPFQDAVKEVAAEKGLNIEWVNVEDWVLPNTELAAGTVDANAFQHILYLSAFNTENGADLTPVFSTLITQWGIFSATATSLDDIADGAKIAIPDDPSNGGRALNILEAAGLITLSADKGDFPAVEDITANPKKLQFAEIPATSIAQQFTDPSLAAVVVGTSYFDPSQNIGSDDALFLDKALSEQNLPYVNVIATREDNKDNPAWKILKDVYADERVAAANEKENQGSVVLVDVPVEQLRTKLADLEKQAAKN